MNSKEGYPLFRRLTTAAGYSGFGTATLHFLRLAQYVVLARLLLPEQFGTFGVAISISEAIRVLSNPALKQAFLSLRPDQEVPRWLNTLWTLEVIRGVLICLVLILISRPLAGLFHAPAATGLIVLIGVAALLEGVRNVGMFLYERDLVYRKVVQLEVLSTLAGTLTAIGLAWIRRDATSLALGIVATQITGTLLSFRLHSFRPRPRLDFEILVCSLRFGRHLLLVGILTFITTQADNLAIARFLDLRLLGLYVIAYGLAMFPVTLLGQVANRIGLPAFAELHSHNPEQAATFWLNWFRILVWPLSLITLAIWTGTPFWLGLIYGEAWLAAVPVLSVLAFVGLFRGMAHLCTPLLLAMHRPDVDARAKALESILFLILLLLLTPDFGLIGAATAALSSYVLAFVIRAWVLLRAHPQQQRRFVRILLKVTAIFLMGYVLKHLIEPLSAAPSLVMLIILVLSLLTAAFLEKDGLVALLIRMNLRPS